MKILIDARLYGLENAGLGRYLIGLIGELAKIDLNDDFEILLREKYFDELNLPKNWKKIEADFRHYSLAEQLKLPRIIENENPDIVHFPHFNVPIFYRGKYVVTIHDMLMHKSIGLDATTLSAPLYYLKRLGYRLVFDNAVKHAIKIVVPSKAVKNELVSFYKLKENKVVVTYEGIDSRIKGNMYDKIQKPYFVYVGNAYPHKNLNKLIEAMTLLNKKNVQRVNLAIASSRGIFTQRLERIIKNKNASSFVNLLGFVPDDELSGLLKNSTGFVFPSISEGFGIPGLEAMKIGTLLLASNIPVFKEIYGDKALYFDPSSAYDIADAMKKALNFNFEDRNKIIRKGREFVKRYSWAKMAEETLEIYKNEGSNRIRPGK